MQKMNSLRFGEATEGEINLAIDRVTLENTKKSNAYVSKQFMEFCSERRYDLAKTTPIEKLVQIMKDWGYNMKKIIKNRDLEFKQSREARNAKRHELQKVSEKRKCSSSALTDEYKKIVSTFAEDTPDGLQKKCYYIACYELAWRGGEAAVVQLNYFHEEMNNSGMWSGRIEYNTVFSKTAQGGNHKLADSKWPLTNNEKPEFCPVRLFKKLMSKRGSKITTNRLFLTSNPFWKNPYSVGWYKNFPVGKNQLGNWTKSGAEQEGIDTKRAKITNHSLRSTAVSSLAREGVGEQQLIEKMRHQTPSTSCSSSTISNIQNVLTVPDEDRDCAAKQPKIINFYNCNFQSNHF